MKQVPHTMSAPMRYTPQARTEGLRLHEIVVFRRLRIGQSRSDIARSLGEKPGTIRQQVRTAMKRYGTDDLATFLALPEVQAFLDAE